MQLSMSIKPLYYKTQPLMLSKLQFPWQADRRVMDIRRTGTEAWLLTRLYHPEPTRPASYDSILHPPFRLRVLLLVSACNRKTVNSEQRCIYMHAYSRVATTFNVAIGVSMFC